MIQTVSYLWREPQAVKGFTSGVSLHSHTNQSKETLDFIAELSTEWGVLQPLMRWCEQRCFKTSGIRPDYARSYWTPPLTPKLAFDLERVQIEDKLQMPAMVSITDHDDINAPMLLRALPGRFRCRWSGRCRLEKVRSTWEFTTCPARPGSSGWNGWKRSRRSRRPSVRQRC